jgi:hypothetical protein
MSETEVNNWKGILNLNSNYVTAEEFIAAATSAGDAVLYRIYIHVKDDLYRIDE